jgi:hypothetical protein
MMAQWEDVYREVVYRLRKIQQSVSSTLWQNVLEEVIQRWQSRQDFRNGKIGAEATVKVGVVNEDVAQKALQRIREFAANSAQLKMMNEECSHAFASLSQRWQHCCASALAHCSKNTETQ